MPQRRVRGCRPSEGLQSLPAVQDRPLLRRRVPETGLDYRWAQGKVWHIRIQWTDNEKTWPRSVGRGTCYIAITRTKVETQRVTSNARVNALTPGHRCLVNGITFVFPRCDLGCWLDPSVDWF